MCFRKTSLLWWIGQARLILCAAYQCMESQSVIFLVRRLMQQDLCASCLMIWNQEFQCSSAVWATVSLVAIYILQFTRDEIFSVFPILCSLLRKHAIKLKEMSEMLDSWEFYHLYQGKLGFMLCFLYTSIVFWIRFTVSHIVNSSN